MKTLRVHLRSGLQLFMITSIDGWNIAEEITPEDDPAEIANTLSKANAYGAFAIVRGTAAKHPGIVRIEDICFIGIDEREEE